MARLSVGTEELTSYPTKQFFADLFAYFKPYKVQFFAATAYRLVGDIANLYPPIGLAIIVNALSHYPNVSSAVAWQAFWLSVAATVVRVVSQYGTRLIGYSVSERVAIDAKTQAYAHLEKLDVGWHEKENSGNKLKKIDRGGDALDQLMRLWIQSYVEVVVNILATIFILGKLNLIVGLILAVFTVVYYTTAHAMMQPAVAATRNTNIQEEGFTGIAFELISNIRTVKVLAMGEGLTVRVKLAAEKLFEATKVRILRFQVRNIALNSIITIARFGTIGVAVLGIMKGQYEVGFLVLIYTYFWRITDAVGELADNAQQVAIARDSIARMKQIVNEPIVIDDLKPGKQSFAADWKAIQVRNLSFGYGSKRVLKDVSFTIHRGEKIGVVGLSGAGKSTLFKLLLKEYEGFNGEICFDETPIQSITQSSYFKQVAVVLQETEVFNFSLKENVLLANQGARGDEAQLQRALSVAHVSDYLSKLPEGIDTVIGEKGVKLSGGERQRLGIARAVFKEPELLFMDEATSHLDSESEEKIQDSLQKFFKNVTAVVIAHRLSTIRQMDRILVLERGVIVEEGSFNALYKKKGRFRQLWEKQKL